MPADIHRNASAARRKCTPEEVDVRRGRGEISCAECRRLKLKCDKGLPCSSCVRRGCSIICPLGSLSTGQGTRSVLGDTAQLHHKVAEMGHRIRQLEDALAIFQSGVSNECHPLLRDELLTIKFGPEKNTRVDNEEPSRDASVDSINALGTLTINDLGEYQYFGRSAGSEALFLAGADMEPTTFQDVESSPLSEDVLRLSKLFPIGSQGEWNTEEALDIIFSFLPTRHRAWSLCETYIEHATWAFCPIKRQEMINDILTPVYRSMKERQGKQNIPHSVSAHKLAVLCMIFSLGSLSDLLLPPCSEEAEYYFHLSRAALSLRSVFDSPEIYTVQAVFLMSTYYSGGGKCYTMDRSWICMSLAAKLAQCAGLHRDSARWHLDPKSVQNRRHLFWEIFGTDLFYSLALGRPPCIRLSDIDCEFPDDDGDDCDEKGQCVTGYMRWKCEFTKEVLTLVTESNLTAQPPNYQSVLDIDLKIRQKPLPPRINHFLALEEHCIPSEYMQSWVANMYRSFTLLYIHRSFFAQALLEYPSNPLRSPYAPSFLAAYRCASSAITATVSQFDRFPELTMRWWAVWNCLISAAVVVGSIIIRLPSLPWVPNALVELGLVIGLFEKGSAHYRKPRSGLAILYRLRAQALHVYSQFHAGNPSPTGDISSKACTKFGEDELALFGGKSMAGICKRSSRRTVTSPSSDACAPSASLTSDTIPSAEFVPDVFSSLADYRSPLSFSVYSSSPSPTQNATPLAAQVIARETEPQSQLLASLHEDWSQWQTSSTFQPFANGPSPPPVFPDPMPTSDLPDFTESSLTIHEDSLMEFGLITSSESGMDEQWREFMRESGLFSASIGPSS